MREGTAWGAGAAEFEPNRPFSLLQFFAKLHILTGNTGYLTTLLPQVALGYLKFNISFL